MVPPGFIPHPHLACIAIRYIPYKKYFQNRHIPKTDISASLNVPNKPANPLSTTKRQL